MAEAIHSIEWNAHPHNIRERGIDWYWVLSLLAVSGAIAAFILGNILFGVLIILSLAIIVLYTIYDSHEPVAYAISPNGIQVGDFIYHYTKLVSFYIDRTHIHGPHILIRRKEGLEHILVIPIPDEYVEEIYELLSLKLKEEHLIEPWPQKIMEIIGIY